MNAVQQSFNSLLQAYMSQPPQMDQAIDKRRIEVLLQINTVLLYRCVALQQYVLNQQNLTSPNYNEKKELYHNYLKRIHYNLTCLASINDIYSSTSNNKRNYTLPQMVYPPPECLELFDHYKLLNQLYPEAMPFFQKKMALARQQQMLQSQNQKAQNSNQRFSPAFQQQNQNVSSPHPQNQARAKQTSQAEQFSPAAAGTKMNINNAAEWSNNRQKELLKRQQLYQEFLQQQQQQQQQGLPSQQSPRLQQQPPQQQQQQQLSNTATPNFTSSAQSPHVNLSNGFGNNLNMGTSTNTPEFNFQQQNAFNADDFSLQLQNGSRKLGSQSQGQASTPQVASQMTPHGILQQGQRGSDSQSVTPSQNRSQDQQNFMSILSPEQILARAASTQSQQPLQQQQQQQQHQQQQQQVHQHQQARFQHDANATADQNQAANLGGFMGSW